VKPVLFAILIKQHLAGQKIRNDGAGIQISTQTTAKTNTPEQDVTKLVAQGADIRLPSAPTDSANLPDARRKR
jgi:hypothetical protein